MPLTAPRSSRSGDSRTTARSRRRIALQLFAPALVVAAVVPVVVAASHTPDPAPQGAPAAGLFARDDAFTVYAGSSRTLDVLRNDSANMRVCRSSVTNADQQQVVYTEPEAATETSPGGDSLYVETRPGYDVDLTVGYSVCTSSGNSPISNASVRLQITPVRPLQVSKSGSRGKLRVENRNSFPLYFTYSGLKNAKPTGRTAIPARTSKLVPVSKDDVFWVGYRKDGDGAAPAGEGTLRHVR